MYETGGGGGGVCKSYSMDSLLLSKILHLFALLIESIISPKTCSICTVYYIIYKFSKNFYSFFCFLSEIYYSEGKFH